MTKPVALKSKVVAQPKKVEETAPVPEKTYNITCDFTLTAKELREALGCSAGDGSPGWNASLEAVMPGGKLHITKEWLSKCRVPTQLHQFHIYLATDLARELRDHQEAHDPAVKMAREMAELRMKAEAYDRMMEKEAEKKKAVDARVKKMLETKKKQKAEASSSAEGSVKD